MDSPFQQACQPLHHVLIASFMPVLKAAYAAGGEKWKDTLFYLSKNSHACVILY